MARELVSPVPLFPPSGQENSAEVSPQQRPPVGGSPARAINAFHVLLLCGLGFLLAATPARNSDLWLHLASGRSLSFGQLPDGTDPFSSTTPGIFWVNHTWLSDLLLFWMYKLGGGTALIVGKAVLTALLAALFFCFRRRGQGVGMLSLAGLAAMLALGPWLSLQPILMSLLGVVLTLYLLERPNLLEGASAEKARLGRGLLVPLFALWANLDGWFLLGPVLVGLYALGELLRRLLGTLRKAPAGDLRTLVLLTVVGPAVCCLATPYGYHILDWPTPLGLTPTEQALSRDPLGQTLVYSSVGKHFAAAAIFRSPGAWAYYFLLAASAASFVLSLRTFQPGRFLAWSALAALSIYQSRAIPFFAVAAAPVLAANVQEWAATRTFSERLRRARNAAQQTGVLAGIALLVSAWPGWLQPAPYQSRGWTLEPNGSLVRLAEQLKRLHAKARLRPDRFALTFSPEVAHYLAWFCPQEKGFVDSRWRLFDGVAADYAGMRRCLLQETSGDTCPELASLIDAHHIDRILLHDSDWDRLSRAYRHLFLATSDWDLLAVEGGATLFLRRNGAAPTPDAFDFRHAAYHPALEKRAPPLPPPPRQPSLFDVFRSSRRNNSADREEAALYLLSFDLREESLAVSWVPALATGVIGCGSGTEPAATASALALRFHRTPPPPPAAPELLLLAIRAARRALSANPDDGNAFMLLGRAYLRLARQTPEAGWRNILPDVSALRRVQILTALEQAVLLRPDLDLAHAWLVQLYIEPDRMFEQGQADRSLDHLRARRRLAANDPERRVALESDFQRLQELIDHAEKIYQANLSGKTDPSKVLARAQLAARYGLSRKALEMLLASYPAIFGKAGVEYELELMLQAGQASQVREVLEPKHEKQIDFFVYHWLKARASASCGDYAEADTELDKGSERLRRVGLTRHFPASPRRAPPSVESGWHVLVPLRSAIAFRVAEDVLMHPLDAEGAAGKATALYFLSKLPLLLEAPARLLRQEADGQVLRGLLALEAGEVETAQQHFRSALRVWGSEGAAGGLDFPARSIAQEMLRRLQE